MPATPFRTVPWAANSVVTEDKLDQLQDNNQWLLENTPRGRYFRVDGGRKNIDIILVAGKTKVIKDPKSYMGRSTVKFGKAFHPDCHPNVTTGIISDTKRKIFCIVQGLGTDLLPNATGFEIVIDTSNTLDDFNVARTFFVSWHAFGYKVTS